MLIQVAHCMLSWRQVKPGFFWMLDDPLLLFYRVKEHLMPVCKNLQPLGNHNDLLVFSAKFLSVVIQQGIQLALATDCREGVSKSLEFPELQECLCFPGVPSITPEFLLKR